MYNTTEVNKAQYDFVRNNYAGFAAHRQENGRYFIKFLTMVGLNSASVKRNINKLA